MAVNGKTSTASRGRSLVRWAGKLALLVVVIAGAALLWLNFVGVPRMLQQRILESLGPTHFDLSAARIRLEGISRLVVENLEFRPQGTNNLPRVRIAEGRLLLSRAGLRGLRLEPSGLMVTGGALEWLLERPGEAPELLLVTNVQSRLAFLPGNEWELLELTGESAGARVEVTARVKNPEAFQDWHSPAEAPTLPSTWKSQVADLLEVLRSVEYEAPPRLALRFAGDAEDVTTLSAGAQFSARGVRSPWGRIAEIEISSSLQPTNQAFENITSARLGGLESEWVHLGGAELQGRARLDLAGSNPSAATLELQLKELDSSWVKLASAEATLRSAQDHPGAVYRTEVKASATPVVVGTWRGTNLAIRTDLEHSLPIPSIPELMSRWLPGLPATRPIPPSAPTNQLAGTWRMELDRIQAPRFAADSLHLFGTVVRSQATSRGSVSLPAFWDWAAPYGLGWSASLSNIQTEGIQLGSVHADGSWRAPKVAIDAVEAALYGGFLSGEASLDVDSREATVSAEADFDYHKVALLLEKPVQRWLEQFTWEDSPWVRGRLSLTVPEWHRAWTNFGRQVLPSLKIEGELRGAGAFRGIPAQQAVSHFHFEDFVWHLPDLEITRPEGKAHLAYRGNVSNQDFEFKFHTQIDPQALQPLFPEEQHEFFEVVEFPEPPILEGLASGRWGADELLSADLRLAVTNFLVKGERYSDLVADVRYTNLIVEAENLLAHRGAEEVRAPYLRIDITNETMFVTNAVSNSDPYVAMNLIGEKVYKAIDPYRFAKPPAVRINGIVPLRHHTKSDLHFEVAGEDFTFWKFRIPYVVGDIFWKGDYLSFSNVQASFYEGDATWSASFYFDEDNDAEFSFAARTVNSDLQPLVADIFDETKEMQGRLTGELVITSAQSRDDRSWNGYGTVRLRDGFLWNIPVFGVFSPALETISPGLGTSKVSAGTADFTLTNTVFYSENMEVRAPAFRLKYDGFVDLDGNLEAEVEAVLLRDTWFLGPVFSLALWPVSKAFEARVSGTVSEPETRLKYVPRFLLAPFRALKEAEKREKESAPSPGPPAIQQGQ